MGDDWSDWEYATTRSPGSDVPNQDSAALQNVQASRGAPVVWLGAAALSSAAGLGLGLLSRMSPGVALAGWSLGGLVSVGLLTVFALKDAAARASGWYARRGIIPIAQCMVVLLAVTAVVVSGFFFADWAGRTW
jgi:hypothetical protein